MFGKDKDNDGVCCVSYINIMSNAGTLSWFTSNISTASDVPS